MEQVQARVMNHEMRNAARKLTPAERKEKKRKKLAEDTSLQVLTHEMGSLEMGTLETGTRDGHSRWAHEMATSTPARCSWAHPPRSLLAGDTLTSRPSLGARRPMRAAGQWGMCPHGALVTRP